MATCLVEIGQVLSLAVSWDIQAMCGCGLGCGHAVETICGRVQECPGNPQACSCQANALFPRSARAEAAVIPMAGVAAPRNPPSGSPRSLRMCGSRRQQSRAEFSRWRMLTQRSRQDRGGRFNWRVMPTFPCPGGCATRIMVFWSYRGGQHRRGVVS